MMKHLTIVFVLALASSMLAATMGTDDAGNYAAGGFTNGANQGTGFQAWNIYTEGSGGTWLGDSTAAGGGDINTSGQSFAMWGNPDGGNYVHCYRKFAGGELSSGQKFSIKLGVNWRNGNKGIDVLSGGTKIFNVNVGGDDYTYSPSNHTATSLGWDWAGDSIIDVIIEQKSGNVLNVSLTRATDSFSQDFTLSGNADEIQLYCGGTDTSGDQNSFYANSLSIIPEPGILGGLLILAVFITRKLS